MTVPQNSTACRGGHWPSARRLPEQKSGVGFNKHLIRRLRRHLPLKGKARAKPFFLPVDFFFEQFSDTHSAPSFCVYSLPLEGKVARRYTYDQPSQEIIGLTHERQHEASIRTGRAFLYCISPVISCGINRRLPFLPVGNRQKG